MVRVCRVQSIRNPKKGASLWCTTNETKTSIQGSSTNGRQTIPTYISYLPLHVRHQLACFEQRRQLCLLHRCQPLWALPLASPIGMKTPIPERFLFA